MSLFFSPLSVKLSECGSYICTNVQQDTIPVLREMPKDTKHRMLLGVCQRTLSTGCY